MHWYILLVSALGTTVLADSQDIERVGIEIEILEAPVVPNIVNKLPKGFLLDSAQLVGRWSFDIQKFETSCSEFTEWRSNSGIKVKNDSSADYDCSLEPEQPVTSISWNMASEFCREKNGRLPTEAEWIVAAVINTGKSQRCFDNAEKGKWISSSKKLTIDKKKFVSCVFNEMDEEAIEDLGLDIIEQQKNEVKMTWPGINGVYGMEGNVWEWTSSVWKPSGVQNSQVSYRVIKGGAFTNGQNIFINNPQWRNAIPQDTINHSNVGFRCVWDNGEALND